MYYFREHLLVESAKFRHRDCKKRGILVLAIIENADGPLSTRTLTNGVTGSFGDGGAEKTTGAGPPRRRKRWSQNLPAIGR